MQVFFTGDYISFDNKTFYEVVWSDDDSVEFKYRDKNVLKWAYVWDVKHVRKKDGGES